MNDNFFKFPSTQHLAALPGADVRDDKVLSESERHDVLQHELVVEEKVDGANLGISFDSEGTIRARNRGSCLYLPRAGQWTQGLHGVPEALLFTRLLEEAGCAHLAPFGAQEAMTPTAAA